MDLLEQIGNQPRNLLPQDGIVHYYGPVMPQEQADHYFNLLIQDITWQHDQAIHLDKTITTKRQIAFYGDSDFSYTYSRTTRKALPWIPVLVELKSLIEQRSREYYNACLLNLYHDGHEGMAWHSDREQELKRHGTIGSLSLGSARKFNFKHKKSQEKRTQVLEHGSLLEMKGTTQTYWLHCLPPTRVVHTPRINLTFRHMVRNR